MKFRPLLLALLFLPLALHAELVLAPEIEGDARRRERIAGALEVLKKYEESSPVLRWSYAPGDSRYAGDLCISLERLDSSTLGQWNGAEIVLSVETMDGSSVKELALILHHEGAHADHHYRDLESVLLNDYSSFFSPRQYLLFEMINEAIAVYKEMALRYRMGLNNGTARKYAEKPNLAYYDEEFFSFYKDLRRWMKSRPEYGDLPQAAFEEALYREYVTGFLADPWYLDYYMPQLEQRFVILRGKDFAVCPMVCFDGFKRFTSGDATAAVLNRYIEKNSPPGMKLGLHAAELEKILDRSLGEFNGGARTETAKGPNERGVLRNLDAYRSTQRNFEALPARFKKLPKDIELRYSFSFDAGSVTAFNELLDRLGVEQTPARDGQ